MAEVTNALIYEVLKAVQSRLVQVDGKVDELKQEVQAVKTQLQAGRQEMLGVRSRA